MKSKTEIKCYALGISLDEIEHYIQHDEEKAALPTTLKGFVGVNPDGLRGMAFFLYLTKKHRDEALQKLKGHYHRLYAVASPAFVDARYLTRR